MVAALVTVCVCPCAQLHFLSFDLKTYHYYELKRFPKALRILLLLRLTGSICSLYSNMCVNTKARARARAVCTITHNK